MKVRTACPIDAEAIAKVHVASWQTTYAGIVPADYLSSLSWQQRSQYWQEVLSATDPHGVYVAEEPEEGILGFAAGGPERSGDPVYTGELYTIYLLEHAQHRGIGRALTRAVVKDLLQYELSSMLVWVLTANPSRTFYEALGGVQVREQETTIEGMAFREVAYGWQDISEMAQPLP